MCGADCETSLNNQIIVMKVRIQLPMLVALAAICSGAVAQSEIVELWDGEVPLAKASDTYHEEVIYPKPGQARVAKVTCPTLEIFRPSTEGLHKAVIICPGGGYVRLSYGPEGTEVAERLSGDGVVAVVLKYRLPSDEIMTDRRLGPLSDVQEAVRYVRRNAERLGVDTAAIGVMGFSAGGHLAASASTLYGYETRAAKADEVSARPDFSVLIYPVVSMDTTITHRGSRASLIGMSASEADVRLMSCEEQVDGMTPRAFVVHASDDRTVSVLNSLRYVEALKRCGVPFELHVFPSGGHGFALGEGTHQGQWYRLLVEWLKTF